MITSLQANMLSAIDKALRHIPVCKYKHDNKQPAMPHHKRSLKSKIHADEVGTVPVINNFDPINPYPY